MAGCNRGRWRRGASGRVRGPRGPDPAAPAALGLPRRGRRVLATFLSFRMLGVALTQGDISPAATSGRSLELCAEGRGLLHMIGGCRGSQRYLSSWPVRARAACARLCGYCFRNCLARGLLNLGLRIGRGKRDISALCRPLDLLLDRCRKLRNLCWLPRIRSRLQRNGILCRINRGCNRRGTCPLSGPGVTCLWKVRCVRV